MSSVTWQVIATRRLYRTISPGVLECVICAGEIVLRRLHIRSENFRSRDLIIRSQGPQVRSVLREMVVHQSHPWLAAERHSQWDSQKLPRRFLVILPQHEIAPLLGAARASREGSPACVSWRLPLTESTGPGAWMIVIVCRVENVSHGGGWQLCVVSCAQEKTAAVTVPPFWRPRVHPAEVAASQ